MFRAKSSATSPKPIAWPKSFLHRPVKDPSSAPMTTRLALPISVTSLPLLPAWSLPLVVPRQYRAQTLWS
ncbi:hypothetical protein CGCF415_v005450 [Colletotrichum fructicola]|nr:hypothetical protein CGCFRS4_v003287 [Colletotrichum fructicola]KAF4910061.1 hypothetical protein CGCF415_v005450 [Colletotrichum fructicola]KAF4932532.1 hypothetical protein CGCF245_v010504 [Colletotrichum fructicola]